LARASDFKHEAPIPCQASPCRAAKAGRCIGTLATNDVSGLRPDSISDRAWTGVEPLLPQNQIGARRVDDRRVISGIVFVLKSGCRWKDCPAVYGPSITIYNRFNRWNGKRLCASLLSWRRRPRCLTRLASKALGRAYRSAHGGKREVSQCWAKGPSDNGERLRASTARRVICIANLPRGGIQFAEQPRNQNTSISRLGV